MQNNPPHHTQDTGSSQPLYTMGQFPVDECRPIKVVVIGAGYSGIAAGIRLRQRVKNIDLTIYEANAGVGGTWYVHRYPGLACDVPAHGYQYTFENNTDWSAFYAPGPEIRGYLQHVADKYKLMPYIKLEHRVNSARYNELTGKWTITVKCSNQQENPNSDEFEDTADILLGCVGALSRWTWPQIEGLETFEGKVIHSAQWKTGEGEGGEWQDTVKSWHDKTIGVIGVGSSALQIVPSLQPKVKHLFSYVRSKTWLTNTFVRESLLPFSDGVEVDNYQFTEKDKEKFRDPEYYKKFRKELEAHLANAHIGVLMEGPVQGIARQFVTESMKKQLSKKPWIADHLIPDFAIGCKRVTPSSGYLNAICEDNVDFIPTPIEKVVPNGIQTSDGKVQELDILICATGYDTSFNLGVPIVGRGGLDLKDHHTPHPRTYLSVAVDGFPNYFQVLGPNSAVGAGSLILVVEKQVDYIVAAVLKVQRERLKSIEVKKEAVDDFDNYLESFFPTTAFGQKCRSWYKVGKEEGRIVALWPGSALHCARTLEHPRWEDYNYELMDGVTNRLHWLGNGRILAETDPKEDKTWYLDEVDVPPGM